MQISTPKLQALNIENLWRIYVEMFEGGISISSNLCSNGVLVVSRALRSPTDNYLIFKGDPGISAFPDIEAIFNSVNREVVSLASFHNQHEEVFKKYLGDHAELILEAWSILDTKNIRSKNYELPEKYKLFSIGGQENVFHVTKEDFVEAFENCFGEDYPKPDSTFYASDIFPNENDPNNLIFGILEGNKIVACSAIFLKDINGTRYAYFHGDAVLDSARGKGLQSCLINARLSYIQEKGGADLIMVTTSPGSASFNNYVNKAGFTEVGTIGYVTRNH